MAAKGFSPTLLNGDLALPTTPGAYAARVDEEVRALWARIGGLTGVAGAVMPLVLGGVAAASTLTLQSTSHVSPTTDKILIRAGQSMASPTLVTSNVSGRLPSCVTVDTYGNWFVTATDGSNESSIGTDYDLEHPFVRVGQPSDTSDPNKPPGTVFNISANITATKSAFNVFDCNVYSNASSTHGHYAGQFTAFSGPSCSGVGAIGVNVFNENAATASHGIVVGVQSSVVISGGDLGGVQIVIGQHGATPRAVDYGFRVASRGTGMSVDMAFQLDNTAVISAAGTILGLRNATRVSCAWGIDFLPNAGVTDATFSGGAFRSTGFSVDGAGIATCLQAKIKHATQSVTALLNAAGTTKYLFGRSLNNDDAQDFFIYDNAASKVRLAIPAAGGLVIGDAALATNATDGFLYIPSCAGTPTGTPTAKTGRVALIYDTSNNKFYVYNGAWKGGTAPGVWS